MTTPSSPTPRTDEAYELFMQSGHTNHDILRDLCYKFERELAEARKQLVAIKQGLAANNISEKQISNDTPLDSPNIDRYEKNIGATLAMLASRDISLAGAAKNVQEELEKIKHEAQAGARRLARDYEYQRNEHIDLCNEAISERDTLKQQFAELEKPVKQNQLQDEEILKLRTQNEKLREAAMTDTDKVCKLWLCESQSLLLKPNQAYIFIMDEHCDKCKALNSQQSQPEPKCPACGGELINGVCHRTHRRD